MKKLFAILAIAGVMAACNDSGKTEEGKKADSTATHPSSAAPAADSSAVADSLKKVAADTTAKPAVDTTKK